MDSKLAIILLFLSSLTIVTSSIILYMFMSGHGVLFGVFYERIPNNFTYMCMGKLCIIYPTYAEYYLALNVTNCKRRSLYIVPSRVFTMSVVCDNSTLSKNVGNITKYILDRLYLNSTYNRSK